MQRQAAPPPAATSIRVKAPTIGARPAPRQNVVLLCPYMGPPLHPLPHNLPIPDGEYPQVGDGHLTASLGSTKDALQYLSNLLVDAFGVAGSHTAMALLAHMNRGASPSEGESIAVKLPNLPVTMQPPIVRRLARFQAPGEKGEYIYSVIDLVVKPGYRVIPQVHKGVMFMKPLYPPLFFACRLKPETLWALPFHSMGCVRDAYEKRVHEDDNIEHAARALMGDTFASMAPPFRGQRSLTLVLQWPGYDNPHFETMASVPQTNAALVVQIYNFVRVFIRDVGRRVRFEVGNPWALRLDRPPQRCRETCFEDLMVAGIMHIGGDVWQPILTTVTNR